MDRTEFLEALREKLKEGMSERDISEQIRYYSDYIAQEVRSGKPESQVLDELGNPMLLARTILDTHGRMGNDSAAEGVQPDHQNRKRGWYVNTDRSWGCIVAAVVIVLVLGIILWMVGSMFRFLSPVLMPVLMILLITAIVKKR